MDLQPTDEQLQIVDSVVAVLTAEFPREAHRGQANRCTEPGKKAMRRIAELGWYGLGLGEEWGGLGNGLVDEALLFTELGRYVGPLPVLGAVLGARVAARAGREQTVQAILSGDTHVGVAVIEDPGADFRRPLNGRFRVLGARECDCVVFVGRDSAALLAMAPGIEPAPGACIDASVSLGVLELHAVTPTVSVSVDDQSIFRSAVILVSAMLLGIGEAARDMAVEHAKLREQFGKPIGAFQAVRHPCAEAAVRCEAARSQLWFAALRAAPGCARGRASGYARGRDSGHADAGFQVAALASLAIDAAHRNCQTNIQVHGAMGGTDEHDAHVLLKRSHLLRGLFGDLHLHLADTLAESLAEA